jgi:thioesterase domain-containing protein
MQSRLRIALTGLLVAGFITACDESDEDPAETPEGVQGQTGLCINLALAGNATDRVLALDASSTIEEAEAARDALNLALTELQQAQSTVPTNEIANLQDAFETYNAKLDSLAAQGSDEGQTLGAAAPELQVAALQISDAQQEMKSSAGCPS